MPQSLLTTYCTEFRSHWRFLAAASLGLASGYQLTTYITNLFAPHLLRAFGWSKSQLALAGAASLLTVIGGPVAGRLTDRVGVRRMALVGVIATPLVFIAYATMNGNLWLFLLINALQIVLMGLTTTSIVYSRLVAQQFEGARGAALAIAACSPAIAGAVAAPLLSALIETRGWRMGYLVLAICTAAGGALAFLLVPRAHAPCGPQPVRDSSRGVYREILRNPAFRVMMFGLLCCNLPQLVQASQLEVILLGRGMGMSLAAWMISLYAGSVVLGRVSCGCALDRWPVHWVVAIALSIPGLGLIVLASGIERPMLLAWAVMILGLSMGAEVDIMGYLVMRFFPLEIFSTVIGLVGAVVALSAAAGSLLLSWTLHLSGNFTIFLAIAGAAAMGGGASFLLLGGSSVRAASMVAPQATT